MDKYKTSFDKEIDLGLLLLAAVFENESGQVQWTKVHRHLTAESLTLEQIKRRHRYLTQTDTSLLHEVPEDFVKGTKLQLFQQNRTPAEIYVAIDKILGHLSVADVRQPSGQLHFNVGEIAPRGVTRILEALDLGSNDIFADIGSGTGNIIAQVLLQSPVLKCYGLEIRQDLANKSRNAFHASAPEFPRLHMATIITGDILRLSITAKSLLKEATVVFSNNVAFQPEANLKLIDLLCSSDNLQVVLLSHRLCARCHHNCSSIFCQVWGQDEVIIAETCWTTTPLPIYKYTRRQDAKMISILDLL